MTVAGLKIDYASYRTERVILGALGFGFQHHDTVEAVQSKSSIRALMVRQLPIDADVMDRFPALEIIQRYGVGVDNGDLEAAKARGMLVCNTPDYGQAHEVSDHALALYLGLSRHIVTRDRDVRMGAWGVDQKEPIVGHRGATLGLIGYGRIAQMAWKKFQALGFKRCLVSDPALTQEAAAKAGVETATVGDICARADVISLHCPLLGATHHVINADMLAAMKPSAFLINVSRGGLIDETALAEALHDGEIAGAGLDVFEVEPPDLKAPLFTAPNTILSDHVAWYSEASVLALQSAAAHEVAHVLSGNAPSNAVSS